MTHIAINSTELDENFFEKDFLLNIRGIEKTFSNRKQIFQKIMEYVFTCKNFQENAHKNYPRNEVIYYQDVNARALLKKLKHLIDNLNHEGVAVQMQIINAKQCLTTHFEKFLRVLGTNAESVHRLKQTISLDEMEIKTIYGKIFKISTHLTYKSTSKEAIRNAMSFFRKLLLKFPADHSNSDDRAPVNADVDIKFITVRKLVEKATEAVDTLIAEKLKQIMILTYDHFIKPLSLMLLLTKRYYTPRPFAMTDQEYNMFKVHHSNTRRKRIIELLTYWVDLRPNDFTVNSDLLALLVIFLESIFKFDKEHACKKDFLELYRKVEKLIEKSKEVTKKELIRPPKQIRRPHTMDILRPNVTAFRKLRYTADVLRNGLASDSRKSSISNNKSSFINDENDFNRSHTRMRATSLMKTPSSFITSRKITSYDAEGMLLTWNTEEIAKQLTLIDLKMFKKIQINQLMIKRWTKPAYHKECKEIVDAIHRFNSMSFWVQYVIISSHNSYQRFAFLNKFIAIAVECLKMHNYASSHSIFTALLRLKNTNLWKLTNKDEDNWKDLEEVFNSATFFQDMENVLRNRSPPAVPSVPFFTNRFFRLQDNVSFLIRLEGNRKYLKCVQLAQLAEYSLLIKKFQSKSYDYHKDHEMYTFFKKGYKNNIDIDLESESAEEILRSMIIQLTNEDHCIH